MPTTQETTGHGFRLRIVIVLIVAGLWRALVACLLPAISRDGVTFCWYARDLGEQGLAFLRSPTAQQHPLFPLLILGVQRTARLLGAPDSPLTWQCCGQILSWLAGMSVVVLVGALAARTVRRLGLPVDRERATILAMLLAALLPLNIWLSGDVMSDQVHLALYLGAVLLMLKLDNWRAALGCGVLSGLAFLTRQEGIVPVAAGLAVLFAHRRHVPWKPLVARGTLVLLGFLACAGPYWAAIGGFTQKKDLRQLLREESAARTSAHTRLAQVTPDVAEQRSPADGDIAAAPPRAALAKLDTTDWPWYALLPQALYKLFRAGRVVVPLLALPPLLSLRRQLLGPVLAGVTTCIAGHFALTVILLDRFGYLAPRHMIVVTALIIPFAAMLLARLHSLACDLRRVWLARTIVGLCVLPLVLYALRLPNAFDGYLVDAARWVESRDANPRELRLLSGSSPRRIAFYAEMHWEYWPEDPAAYNALARQIKTGGRGYLAVVTGPGFERAGNHELVRNIIADEGLRQYVGQDHVLKGLDETAELHLIELRAAGQ